MTNASMKMALILSLAACLAGNATAEPFFQSELIFPPQEKHCHGSSIVQIPDGSFLACWFYGSGERSADDVQVQGARLAKDGKEWSEVFQMADVPGFPDCNPVLSMDPKGRLRLFWITVMAHGWQHSMLRTRFASDPTGEGAPKWDWQDTIFLNPGEEFVKDFEDGFKTLDPAEPIWAEYALPYTELILGAAKDDIKRQTGWMTRIHPLTLPSGRMLLPLYSDGFNCGLMAISDDGGDTWSASHPLVGMGPIQPTVVRKKDGTIVAYMRDSGGPPSRVLVSESKDAGETWTPAVDSDIPNSGSSLEIIALADGRWVIIYNDTEQGRHQLALAISEDEGKTWNPKRYLDKAEKGEGSFAYPSLIQAADGRLHATYTHSKGAEGKSIKHVALDVDWISAEK